MVFTTLKGSTSFIKRAWIMGAVGANPSDITAPSNYSNDGLSQTWFIPLFPRGYNLSRASLSISTVQASYLFYPFPRPKSTLSPLLSYSCFYYFSSTSSEFELDQTRVLRLRNMSQTFVSLLATCWSGPRGLRRPTITYCKTSLF